MRKYILPILLMSLLYWSCEDEAAPKDSPYIGTWNLNYWTEGFVDSLDTDTSYANGDNKYYTLILGSDGNYNYDFRWNFVGAESHSKIGNGTWSVTGNELTMMGEFIALVDSSVTFDVTLSNEGQTMAIYHSHIYDPDINSVVFTNLMFDKEPS